MYFMIIDDPFNGKICANFQKFTANIWKKENYRMKYMGWMEFLPTHSVSLPDHEPLLKHVLNSLPLIPYLGEQLYDTTDR